MKNNKKSRKILILSVISALLLAVALLIVQACDINDGGFGSSSGSENSSSSSSSSSGNGSDSTQVTALEYWREKGPVIVSSDYLSRYVIFNFPSDVQGIKFFLVDKSAPTNLILLPFLRPGDYTITSVADAQAIPVVDSNSVDLAYFSVDDDRILLNLAGKNSFSIRYQLVAEFRRDGSSRVVHLAVPYVTPSEEQSAFDFDGKPDGVQGHELLLK